MDIKQVKQKIRDIESTRGDEERLLELLKQARLDLKETRSRLANFALYDQLVTTATRYLSEAHPSQCPVCGQPIDHRSVLERLSQRVKASIAEEVRKLREAETAVEKEIRETERILEEHRAAAAKLATLEKTLDRLRRELERLVGERLADAAAVSLKLEELKKDVETLTTTRTVKLERQTALTSAQEAFKRATSSLNSVQKELQQLLRSNLTDEALAGEAEAELRRLEEEKAKYQAATEIDALRGQLARLKAVLAYLKEEEEAEKIREELPSVNRLISDYRSKIEGLRQLDEALRAIHHAASEYGRETVTTALSSLEDTLNQFYREPIAHPHFRALKVSIEKEQPLLYSIKAVGDSQSTYIPTRFSHSQMNVAALSIFFSNYTKMAPSLRFLALDDPTQNLDVEHKRALCRVLKELAKGSQLLISTQDEELIALMAREFPDAKTIELKAWSPRAQRSG